MKTTTCYVTGGPLCSQRPGDFWWTFNDRSRIKLGHELMESPSWKSRKGPLKSEQQPQFGMNKLPKPKNNNSRLFSEVPVLLLMIFPWTSRDLVCVFFFSAFIRVCKLFRLRITNMNFRTRCFFSNMTCCEAFLRSFFWSYDRYSPF